MTDRPNLLVVCGRNKKRSRTAEHIFKNDERFNIRSVGLSPKSERKITEQDLNWADLVFVMEAGVVGILFSIVGFLYFIKPIFSRVIIPFLVLLIQLIIVFNVFAKTF